MKDDIFYDEAVIEKIIRPQNAADGQCFDKWVTSNSRQWQRIHFVQIRRYLSLEFKDYGCNLDCSNMSWNETVAYSFLDPACQGTLVGAAFFDTECGEVTLSSCWLHPFFRHQGLVKEAWPEFITRFDSFYVETPVSKTMIGLLQSINYQGVINLDEVKGYE